MPLRLGIFGSTVLPRRRRSARVFQTLRIVVAASCVDASRNAQADKFMALAKESETFDEYSIEKRGSCVRLEKQIGTVRRPSPSSP